MAGHCGTARSGPQEDRPGLVAVPALGRGDGPSAHRIIAQCLGDRWRGLRELGHGITGASEIEEKTSFEVSEGALFAAAVWEVLDLLERFSRVPDANQRCDGDERVLGPGANGDDPCKTCPQPKESQYGGNLPLHAAGAERLAIARRVPYAPALTMRRAMILGLLGLAAAGGCKQHIGDKCNSSTDCSVTGERQCDLSQPGGYCTVFSCDPDTCPEGACVEWRFIPSRTAETWCMKTCDTTDNCRLQYSCVFPGEITTEGTFDPNLPSDERVARIIDLETFKAEAKICVALASDLLAEPPAELDGGL